MPSIDAVFHFTCATTHPQLPSHQWCPACSRPCCSLIRASLHFASEPGFLSSEARHLMGWCIETMKPPSTPIFVEKVRHIRMLKKWIKPNFMVHELHEPSIFMWLNHVPTKPLGGSAGRFFDRPFESRRPSKVVNRSMQTEARHFFNGNSRILKWRYCTIIEAIFCGDIPLHRPKK